MLDSLVEKRSRQLATFIRQERQRQGFSLNELARRAELVRQTISLIEANQQSPSVDTLSRIGFALGMEADELLRRAKDIELEEAVMPA